LETLGLNIKPEVDFSIINNENDHRFKDFWTTYYNIKKRKGVSIELAKREVTRSTTLIGALAVHLGLADALICGTYGRYHDHLSILRDVIGYDNEEQILGSMNALILPQGNLFITDTFVNNNPSLNELYHITVNAIKTVERFGINPRVALLSHSNFGSDFYSESAKKMRELSSLLKAKFPELEIDGEMHGDAAIVPSILEQSMPDSSLKHSANLLVMPNIEAANIAYNLLRVSSPDGITVGPILMGLKKPAHILSPISSVRRIVNMVALASVESQ
jgi:malate dehydrogenase (oxaloacetate-decarboxylating)(NADP+)